MQINKLLTAGGIPGFLLIGNTLIYVLFSRQRTTIGAYDEVDNSAIAFIIYTFICFGFCYKMLFHKKHILFIKSLFLHSPLRWFLLFTILGGISSLWSVNFALTGYRAFECLTMIMLISALLYQILKKHPPIIAYQWLLLYVAIDITIRVINNSRWVPTPLMLLRASQMLSTIFIFLSIKYSPKWYITIIIIVFALFSGSTTSYIGMFAGISGLMYGKLKHQLGYLILCTMALYCIAFMGLEPFLKKTIFNQRRQISLKDTSDRNEIFEQSWKWGIEKPYTGWGFVAGENYLIKEKWKRVQVSATHNSILSALLGEGFLGAFLILMFLVDTGRLLFKNYIPHSEKPTWIATYIVCLAHCMGNPSIGTRVGGAWIGVMLVFTTLCSLYIIKSYNTQNTN